LYVHMIWISTKPWARDTRHQSLSHVRVVRTYLTWATAIFCHGHIPSVTSDPVPWPHNPKISV
jgi:hypothetical protein